MINLGPLGFGPYMGLHAHNWLIIATVALMIALIRWGNRRQRTRYTAYRISQIGDNGRAVANSIQRISMELR